MKKLFFYAASLALSCNMASTAKAQSVLYPQTFNYSEVTLNDGVFKTAEELNYKVLFSDKPE